METSLDGNYSLYNQFYFENVKAMETSLDGNHSLYNQFFLENVNPYFLLISSLWSLRNLRTWVGH